MVLAYHAAVAVQVANELPQLTVWHDSGDRALLHVSLRSIHVQQLYRDFLIFRGQFARNGAVAQPWQNRDHLFPNASAACEGGAFSFSVMHGAIATGRL